MAPHPLFKHSSITLPLHFTQFSSQENMIHPTKQLPISYLSFPDHFNDSYDHAMNQDSKLQKPAQNHANYMFKAEKSFDEVESGISSPPLWKTSHQHENNVDYRCLSPSSRTQAIARAQKELMEMVSKLPESCYELTLKDLVEHQPAVLVETEQESFSEGRVSSSTDEPNKYKKEKQNNNQKPQIKRSGSVDKGGFLLKMVFPVSLGSKKKKKMNKEKKKNDCNRINHSKVSPKPIVTGNTSGNNKTVDKDWWKKRSGSSKSDGTGSTGSTKSSRSSSRSSGSYRSISSTSRRHRRNSCLAFILCRKNKASR